MTDEQKCYANTDRELYREPDKTGNGDYYSDSIHVTDRGSIGINVGGDVIVMPLRLWHEAATAYRDSDDTEAGNIATQLDGWKEPENMTDDRARQFWLMRKAAGIIRRLLAKAVPAGNLCQSISTKSESNCNELQTAGNRSDGNVP